MTIYVRSLPTPKRNDNGIGYHIRWREGSQNRRKNFVSREEANAWIQTEMATDRERGKAGRAAGKLDLAHYAEEYLTLLAADAKERYLRSERSKVQYAIAYFKRTPVEDIKPLDCLKFRAEMAATPTRTGRPPRPATVNHAYRALHAVLNVAVAAGALTANPAEVKGRKRKTTKQAEFEGVYLTQAEVDALAEALTAQGKAPYDLMVRFLAGTGLRASENCGLNVGDVVLRKTPNGWVGHISVTRNRYKLDGEWVEETPKSKRSVRKVRLPGWLAAEMADYIADRADDPDAPLWPNRQPGGGVTRGPRKGAGRFRLNWCEPVEMGSWHRNVMRPAAIAAGLPATLRVHDLRHTFAGLWIASGASIPKLSEQMGHENTNVTLAIYAKIIRWHEDDDATHPLDRESQPDMTNVVPMRRRRSA